MIVFRSEMARACFVIGYDIVDPRRLQRVRRIMCRYAAPLEYSVFFLVGSVADKDRCLQEVASLIDPAQDDVRCYALPSRGFQRRIGRACLPEGVRWTGYMV